ncbi:MAG: ABC-2 transporter permease [Clostridiales bacterium]|nr:ABC-2 transporter permease [Clostridiales bacterium]
MGGLLYKDYLAVKAKKIVYIILALTVLFAVLRIVLPGGDNENSEGYTYDALMWVFPALLVFAGIGIPSAWTKALIAGDEKKQTQAVIKSLPLGKNTLIASKYIFTGVTVYALLSAEIIWCTIYSSFAGNNSFYSLIEVLTSFLIIFSSASILIAGVELPFFITIGSKKATTVKTALLEFLFLLVIAYLFFGNIDALGNFDLFDFIEWAKTHDFEINVTAVLMPVISSAFFYLSYRLTCRLNKNREADYD